MASAGQGTEQARQAQDVDAGTSRAQTQTLSGEAVLDALKMILTDAPLNDVLHSVALLIEAHSEGLLCTIYLLDEDGLRLRFAAGPKLPDAYRVATDGVCIGPEVGSCGAAAYLRKPVFVADVLTHPHFANFRDLLVQAGLRAVWSAPIISHEGKVLGTFGMYNREARHPSPAQVQLIDYASRIAGIAIDRDRSKSALALAFEKIKSSEAELREIVDAIPQTIIVLNPDGKAIYANRVALEYTGLSLDEVRADDFRTRVFHPDDVQRLREERDAAFSSALPFENEQRALGRDGKYRWFLIRYNPLLDENGKVLRWYATGTDIEYRKQAENKLRQEERELRQLIDLLPQFVVVLDKDGTLLQANKTLLDYTGFTLEEMKAAGTREQMSRHVPPEDLERLEKEESAGLSKGRPFQMEKRLLGKDGRYRWFLCRYNPVLNEAGDIVRWFGTATDIEDRKQAENRVRNENVALREEIEHISMFEEIVGSSEALRRVLAQVSKVARTDSTVLISGETGTGKELIARAIHSRSNRSTRAFIRVNCAAISSSLIASELFGHERGSFTGAHQRRLGRFESADGGTIFLDEVGEIPPETQVALLRVLQEHEFERVGGNQTVRVDVRVLAATNKDLRAAVAEGTFRQDLFYRLNVFPIQVPALRDRIDDIPLLVEYLVDRYAKKAGKRIRRVSKNTLDLFQGYDWPGNIRELQNVVERAVVLCEGEIFCVDPSWLTPASSGPTSPNSTTQTIPLTADLAGRERAMIENALREAEGLISGPAGAAAKLGIPRQTLESKIRRLRINRHLFKAS